ATEKQACIRAAAHLRAPVAARMAARAPGLTGPALMAVEARARAEPARVSERPPLRTRARGAPAPARISELLHLTTGTSHQQRRTDAAPLRLERASGPRVADAARCPAAAGAPALRTR